MWRVHSLFGQAIDASLHLDTHESTAEHEPMLGHHVAITAAWAQPAALCRVCHAELLPHEFQEGCCADRDSCSWRALSERCCW